jgi:hypothetical protein
MDGNTDLAYLVKDALRQAGVTGTPEGYRTIAALVNDPERAASFVFDHTGKLAIGLYERGIVVADISRQPGSRIEAHVSWVPWRDIRITMNLNQQPDGEQLKARLTLKWDEAEVKVDAIQSNKMTPWIRACLRAWGGQLIDPAAVS